MTMIRCWEYGCIYNENGACSAEEMEYHPDHGCLTMVEREDYEPGEPEWEEEEVLEEDEWEDEDEDLFEEDDWDSDS